MTLHSNNSDANYFSSAHTRKGRRFGVRLADYRHCLPESVPQGVDTAAETDRREREGE